MTDFTNGATTPSKPADEGKTDFTGNNVNPNENNQNTDDQSVVLEFNGRKFTKEDLIKKLSSADEFIDTLKQERQQDRALLEEVNRKLAEQVNARELLNQVNSGKKPEGEQPNQPQPKAVDPSEIAKQVMDTLKQQQSAQEQDKNWNEVTATLTGVFGDKTNAKVQQVAKENDMTLEEAAQLARTKPRMFLKLFPELNSGNKPTGSGLFTGNSSSNNFKQEAKAPASTGYSKSRTTKESVQIYMKRLNELSGK